MTETLQERLRDNAAIKEAAAWERLDGGQCLSIGASLAHEAADALDAKDAEIGELRERLASAEAVLRAFADAANDLDDNESGEIWERPAAMNIECADLRAARAHFAKWESKDG